MAAARKPTVFTIGVYGSDEGTFFDALATARIDVFLDIRRRRAVRGSRYAFANAKRLIAGLAARNIAYRHIIDLAPHRSMLALQHAVDASEKRRFAERTVLAPEYIRRYVPEVLDEFDFDALARALHGCRAPVLFCIERIPQACHRSLAAPRLAAAFGTTEIVHLIPKEARVPSFSV
jgi:uncharacterized protein (DUF488 family)